MSRFKVATCTGYPLNVEKPRTPGNAKPGLTASVLDTLNCHREVARYRSEDRPDRFHPRGHEGALRAAQDYADKLNAECG